MSARSFNLKKRRQGNITVNHDGLNFYEIILHETSIFTKYNDGSIVLSSGGWQTKTTKTAINRAFHLLDINACVWQKNFTWKLTYEGITTQFEDGMVVAGSVWKMVRRLAIG
jgi:hypothetical protein